MSLQCLTLTMQVPVDTVIVLDALRKQRNLTDYLGDPVSMSVLAECIEAGDALLGSTVAWLRMHQPDWLETS